MIVIKLDFSLGDVESCPISLKKLKQWESGHVAPGLFRHGHVKPESGPERLRNMDCLVASLTTQYMIEVRLTLTTVELAQDYSWKCIV